ncbi:MAG: NlpC/P60 family protein [Desulfobacterales bacterium]
MNHQRLPITKLTIRIYLTIGIVAWLLMMAGCGARTTEPVKASIPKAPDLQRMGYTIQVGAFSNIDNAVRLTASLKAQGIDAYHFLDPSGLYKVRFENFRSKAAARNRAINMQRRGIIESFYIVKPEAYAIAQDAGTGNQQFREKIVKTARRYLGVPYRWGGESPRTGFDCSGYTMVVYRLNGLDLPRSSRQQWEIGKQISRRQLQKGDLVFFATSGGGRISHVGIYTGEDKFLHAPSKGSRIKTSSLSSKYFRSRYVGARSYL